MPSLIANQCRQPNVERFRDSDDHEKRWIADAALDARHVRAVDSRPVGKGFLRQAFPPSQALNSSANTFQNRVRRHRLIRSKLILTTCGLSVHGLSSTRLLLFPAVGAWARL